jgi:DHA1 family multidrug resistance protein-like MFS transporter
MSSWCDRRPDKLFGAWLSTSRRSVALEKNMMSQSPATVAATDAMQNSASLHKLRLCVLLASLPFGMLLFGLPLIAREMGASALAIGGLLAIYSLIIVVGQPIVGYGLDRFGRRPFLIAGLLGYAFSNAVFGLVTGVGSLYLAQLAQGVGSGLLWLAVLAIVSDLAPDDCRGKEYGRLEEMAFRGTLIGSVVGFAVLYLLSRDAFTDGLTLIGGWRVLFLGFTAATLLAAAIVWRGIPESLPRSGQHSGRRSGDRPEAAPAIPEDQPVAMAEKWHLPGQLRILLGIVVLTAIAAGILSPILIKHLSDSVSADLFIIALAFLPAAIAGSVLPSRLGGLSDRFGRRPPLIAALLVSGLTALAVPLARSLWPLALLWVLEAAAFAAATPAEEALVVDISGDERQGAALGYYTAAAGLGGVIGPLMGGWLYDRFAALGAFGISALLMVLGAALVLLFVREPSRTQAPAS